MNQKGFAPIIIILGIILILGVAGGTYYFGIRKNISVPVTPIACTQEAKICPDGSSVGRIGPNCEFKSCPVSKSVPDQTSCINDSDCGVNICQCVSLKKELIKEEDKMCTRFCPGDPKCVNNQCVLKDTTSAEGKDCGGFAGEKGLWACPTGFFCKYPEPIYPDASGKCTRK